MENKIPFPLIIGPGRLYFTMLSIGVFVLFFVPGILLLFDLVAKRPPGEDPRTHVILGLLFCAIGLGTAAYSPILYRKICTRISTEGIYSPLFSKETIPWTAVTSIRAQGIKTIYIDLDYDASRMTTFSRLNRTFGQGSIVLSTFGGRLSYREAKSLIEEMARSRLN